MKEYLFLLIVLACSTGYVHGLSCLPCNMFNCTKQDCGRSGYTLGICGCCNVCAKAFNESCRGIWNTLGTCDKNLTCNSTADQIGFDSIFAEGICTDAECKAIVDVMFAVDGSRSLGESTFNSIKTWLTEAISMIYQRYGACAHVGALVYATDFPENFSSPFGLGECTNNEDCYGGRLKNNASLIQMDGSYTYRALHAIVQDYFPKSERYERSQKVIVVVSDETPLSGPTDRQSWRNVSMDNNIDTYVVALSFPSAIDWNNVISGNGKALEASLPIANTTTRDLVQDIWDNTVRETVTCSYPTKYTPCKSSSCSPTCEEPFAVCPVQCDEPGCVCDEGYVRRSKSNATCIRYDDCPQRKCIYPEVYRECSSVCNATCDNLNPICITVCGPPRCECADGYVWRSNEDRTCVPKTSCPKECPNGLPLNCFANACAVERCPSNPNATCKARCNGCIADFFDQFGNNITDKCKPLPCIFPEVYRECSSPCNATCADPTPVCIERCDSPKCECADGYVRTSAQNRTCIPQIRCPAKTCTRECPNIDILGTTGCSQQLSLDAWLCQLSNWKCSMNEWKSAVESWGYVGDCYALTGDIEARWRRMFTCDNFPLAQCTTYDAYRYEIDAFGCEISYCAKGGYKDVTQPLQMWQRLFVKHQDLMQIYKDVSQLCGRN